LNRKRWCSQILLCRRLLRRPIILTRVPPNQPGVLVPLLWLRRSKGPLLEQERRPTSREFALNLRPLCAVSLSFSAHR
jgi:hypothetical protein